ncbi:hypothetical protein VF21_06838 [Pseudogymnoascus sp. 05NY08]|nr:hypothetical protein VF21_06838 [Pseudogymnoascus sp. 05NY08]
MGTLDIVHCGDTNDSSNSNACNVQAVHTPEITQANRDADNQFGTELGGVKATSALQIAIVAQEITPADDTTNNLQTSELQAVEAVGATEISKAEKLMNGGFGTGSKGTEPLDWNEQDPKESLFWKYKLKKKRLLSRKYCTQACLLGLKRGLSLHEGCPNVESHRSYKGSTHHHIDVDTFTRRVREQIVEFSDRGCTHLGVFGSKGTLFKLMLSPFGYTFVGKGAMKEHIPNLRHEAIAYQHRLDSLQGEVVPVYLGSIDMVTPYRICVSNGVHRVVVHMMLISWSGDTLEEENIPTSEADRSLREVMQKGVVHNDMFSKHNGSGSEAWRSVREHTVLWGTDPQRQLLLSNMRKYVSSYDIGDRNMLWNSERKRVMLIDFERSLFIDEESDESDGPTEPGESDKPEESSRKRKIGAQEGILKKKIKTNNTTIKNRSLGPLGTLPSKLRKIIYEYAISPGPRFYGKLKSGLGLLATSTMIYKETIPLIYQSQLFGIEIDTKTQKFAYEYIKPGFDICWGSSIRHLSPDMVDFVQNLRLRFTHKADTNIECLHMAMAKFGYKLQHNTHLQSLHISMDFPTNDKDDDAWTIAALSSTMKRLLRGENFDITRTPGGISEQNVRNTRLTIAYKKS